MKMFQTNNYDTMTVNDQQSDISTLKSQNQQISTTFYIPSHHNSQTHNNIVNSIANNNDDCNNDNDHSVTISEYQEINDESHGTTSPPPTAAATVLTKSKSSSELLTPDCSNCEELKFKIGDGICLISLEEPRKQMLFGKITQLLPSQLDQQYFTAKWYKITSSEHILNTDMKTGVKYLDIDVNEHGYEDEEYKYPISMISYIFELRNVQNVIKQVDDAVESTISHNQDEYTQKTKKNTKTRNNNNIKKKRITQKPTNEERIAIDMLMCMK